jgi:hypothetical protein
MRRANLVSAPLFAAVTLLLAAGCAVSNPFAPSNASAKSRQEEQRALRWAQCMRQHGVNVADPGRDGRITINDPGGRSDAGQGPSPELQAATDACRRYQPGGGQGDRPPNQHELDAAVKFTQCMRSHGISMQDPKVENGSLVIGANADRSVDTRSDQFRQAQQACAHYLDHGGSG